MKEEELFYWWKVSKFLLAALFANARRVDVSKFRVENAAILRLRPRKLIFLLFSKIKGFVREQLNAIYGQKMKTIDFSTVATRSGRYFLTVGLKFSHFIDITIHSLKSFNVWKADSKYLWTYLIFFSNDPQATFNDTSNWREDHGICHQLHYARSHFIWFKRKLLE